MINSTKSISIFHQANEDYHRAGELMPEIVNPFADDSLEHLLYVKGWVDAVQWHLEDEVRRPDIKAEYGWQIKKEIDRHNQWRTDTVEQLDHYLFDSLKAVKHKPSAQMNSESPGNILDRLSILELKIYHMKLEARRSNAGSRHMEASHRKLEILLEQEEDLSMAFDQLMGDLADGIKFMKVYYQMKMYNDEQLNPAIYSARKKGS